MSEAVPAEVFGTTLGDACADLPSQTAGAGQGRPPGRRFEPAALLARGGYEMSALGRGAGAPVVVIPAAAAGTPRDHAPRWVDFEHRGEPRATMCTTSCCPAYQWPPEPGATPRRDGLDPQWDRYCATCPLLPSEELAHRAAFWADRPAVLW